MTRSASSAASTQLVSLDRMLALLAALVLVLLIAAPVLGADPSIVPDPSVAPSATAPPCPLPAPTTPPGGGTLPPQNLCPASLSASDPVSVLAWVFTPIFQVIFMGMAFLYNVIGDIGIAIILLTIAIRILLVPLYRRQLVSQRRMQLLQPELRASAVRFKGNRAKISEEQMRIYRERGVNPAAGCLPAVLQLILLIPMYQVIAQGLAAPDITSMLQVFGNPIIDIACQAPGSGTPCIDPTIPWLDWITPAPGGLDAHRPEVLFMVIPNFFGISVLAVIAAVLQLLQTRMTLAPGGSDDPQARMQQRIFLILPLISLFYGWFLPSGLFMYWITTTIFSIVQQYLITGWGGLFPLFGWTPGLARDHQPRFPIPSFTPRDTIGTVEASPTTRRSPSDRAAGTIRPARSRGRTSRRGRRR